MSKSNREALKNFRKTAKEKLDFLWAEISSIPAQETNQKVFVVDSLRKKIEQLVNSKIEAFRYALLTQTLAKVVDAEKNCLSLQVTSSPRSFDARSFCKEVVVPFEGEKLDNILGGSKDPYVSKPLRHEEISLNVIEHIKDKEGWKTLYDVLIEIEKDEKLAIGVLKQVLLEIRKRLLRKPLELPSIPALTVDQLREIMVSHLAKPSEGARPQVVVYALLKTFNERTRTYAEITTAKATAPDSHAGRVADIECRNERGDLKLAVCVTDVLDTKKVEDELQKATRNKVKNLLLVGHRIRIESQELYEKTKKYASVNVAVSSVLNFITLMVVMLNSEMRQKFVLNVYNTYKEQGYFDHLREWDQTIREKLLLG
jgi:hypothetical protein